MEEEEEGATIIKIDKPRNRHNGKEAIDKIHQVLIQKPKRGHQAHLTFLMKEILLYF
jgi:hypothetical protein